MNNDNFLFKSYCEFIIGSEDYDLQFITKELKIEPDRILKKDDTYISIHSGSICTNPYNVWAIRSNTTISEEEEISQHFEFFRSLFRKKINILKKFKEDVHYNLTFWIWIETDDAGFSLELLDSEISFMNNITNNWHITLLTNQKIEI